MDKEEKEFSLVKFFDAFQKRVKKINTFPISTENLNIHQDLVKMLGEEDTEFFYPFASLVMDRPQSFDDLLFSLELYDKSFIMSIDQQFPFEVPYDALNIDEEKLADALIGMVTGLANGQILILATLIDDDVQATEVLYQQKNAKLFNVLRTFAYFDKKSKHDDANYSTKIHRNKFEIDQVRIDTKLLEQFVPLSLEVNASNRKPFLDLDSPLTKSVYKKNVDNGSEIWSQNLVANWIPGYNPNKKHSKIQKFVEYSYYRYVEVVSVLAAAVLILTLDSRAANLNILLFCAVLLFAVTGTVYLKKVGYAMWIFRIFAYIATPLYVVFFYNLQLEGFWMWFIAIIALEPVLEMLVVDFYKLANSLDQKKRA